MEESRGRESTDEVKQLISFTVASEEYGFELFRVKEVIRMRQITWLPKAPACVKGIINLRGDVVPIVDLRERFGLAAREQTAMTRVIVVEMEGTLVGIVVDFVSQVVRIPADQFEPPPAIMGAGARDLVNAVAKMSDRLIIIIDVDRILSADEMTQISNSLEVAQESLAEVGHEKEGAAL